MYIPVFVGLPRAPDYQCGGGQPANQHPELVQEGTQAVSQPHAHRGALPLPGWVRDRISLTHTFELFFVEIISRKWCYHSNQGVRRVSDAHFEVVLVLVEMCLGCAQLLKMDVVVAAAAAVGVQFVSHDAPCSSLQTSASSSLCLAFCSPVETAPWISMTTGCCCPVASTVSEE